MLNLEAFWKLRLMFPELTESQFQVLMYYAFGSDSESIADILKCSKNAVKLSLRKKK
ncbi:LuxR C-terminal-related transcriptional regulator [Erwinia tracheiphila]